VSSSTGGHRRPSRPSAGSRNRLVALILLAALSASCSGSPEPAAKEPDGPILRVDGPGQEPPAGEALDAGATTVARSPSGRVRLATLSSRAGLVTGGDVLVEVRVQGSDAPKLTVDDRAVTGLPAPDGEGRIRHLVTGLAARATLIASVGEDAADRARLTVEDHPADGPLFAGPRIEPFVCKNETVGLAKATGADCSAPTVTKWSYRAQDGMFHDLEDPRKVPPNVSTTTVDGHAVPYIVRDEQGVIDRSLYRLVVLDPEPGTGPNPAWGTKGWNGRLVHRYGGGCSSQFANNAGPNFNYNPLSNYLLNRGYAVITSTLNTFQAMCNPTLSAEVTARLREHFIEHYGVPRFVIGDGGSGGSIQQLAIAYNYPGLLDGITPWLPFPDAMSISPGVTDCGLLVDYRSSPAGRALNDEQWAAISGFATFKSCEAWKALYVGGVNPTDGCDAELADQVYDAATRPNGVRCTNMDSNVNTMGRDPATGFARRPLDNTGVQYGLAALQAGTITADQFLDLNERIGGYDIDGTITPARSTTDDESVAVAHRTGAVIADPGPLADVPMIFLNEYADGEGDIHDSFRSFSVRQRLKDARLDTRNAVVWTQKRGIENPEPAQVVVIDEWLTRAAASPADRPWPERLAANRPELGVDTCRLEKETVRGDAIYDEGGPCLKEFPHHADPRLAAGAPLRNDIMKCAHRPVDDGAVKALRVELSPEQRERYARIFATGVCDWTRPGQGIAPWAGPWQRY
jgi:hypothetical protein